ncbi:MAG: flagellar hook-length control protein FliK [Lachnospiraceae bacterium]|nr:flagellar hook-length control protein FliK [Lachnospiraceae bacterium]
MILSDFFPGAQFKNTNTQRTNTTRTNSALTGKQTDGSVSNSHLQALKPGQTLQGEVISRDGNQVQIRLEDDTIVEGKLDQDMNLQAGKAMTFEVRGNGQNLTLSPLFENTATQANALKALEMASIPANQTTVSMTGLMMEAGLPVDRNSLQQMFREVNNFPGAGISNIVDLHKLGLSVNEQNLQQIDSYKNLTHQLVEGMHTVLDALPETIDHMVAEGNVEGAARMFQDLLSMVEEGAQQAIEQKLQGTEGQIGQEGQTVQDGQTAQNGQTVQGEQMEQVGWGSIPGEAVVVDGRTMAADTLAGAENGKIVFAEPETGVEITPEAVQEIKESSPNGLMQLVQSDAGGNPAYTALVQQFSDALQNGTLEEQAKALQQLVHQGQQDKNHVLLEHVLSNKDAQKLLSDGLSRLWTIEPKDVAEPGKVDELYSRLNRQLNHLQQTLEESGQQQSTAFKAVSNMSQNIDFLQQLNQAYTYVQLPLRLQQGDAHGDLYVYTNKRNLAAKDGQISALLHLDMQHLGPVDVYVAMQSERVSTRFYVQDDEMLDFLEQHMDLLNERLQKRGYNCSFSMQTRDEKAKPESGLHGLLAGDDNQQTRSIAQYAFDVRA